MNIALTSGKNISAKPGTSILESLKQAGIYLTSSCGGKGTCGKCIGRCPAGAITEGGHDKLKCYEYGRVVAKEMTTRLQPLLKPHHRRINGEDNISYPVGCAFCQFGVPCTEKIPAA